MKKLNLLLVALMTFSVLGFSANGFAGHKASHKAEKNNTMSDMKASAREAERVSADLINEAGGAANRAVGDAADAISKIGESIENGFKRVTHKAK